MAGADAKPKNGHNHTVDRRSRHADSGTDSSQPSARIKQLDVSKARALPGVACVLTAEDLPDAKLVTDMPGQTGQKRRAGSDAPVLAADRVRFAGEPIALVAAETLDIAERALELIEVQY